MKNNQINNGVLSTKEIDNKILQLKKEISRVNEEHPEGPEYIITLEIEIADLEKAKQVKTSGVKEIEAELLENEKTIERLVIKSMHLQSSLNLAYSKKNQGSQRNRGESQG